MAEPGIRKVERGSLTWQAEVYDARTGRRLRKHHRTLAEARAWRQDAQREYDSLIWPHCDSFNWPHPWV